MKARIPGWQDWPLAIRLTLLIAILIASIVIIITWVTLRRERAAFRDELQQQTAVLLDGLEGVTGDALYVVDMDTIDDLVQGLKRRDVLVFGQIYDSEGRILADAVEPSNAFSISTDPFAKQILESDAVLFDWQPDRLIAGKAVMAGPQVLGAISVGLPTSTMDAKLVSTRNQGIGLALGAIVIGIVVAFIFSRTITNPIQEMANVAEQLAAGNMSARIEVSGSSELGTLAAAYNNMADQLEQNISVLEQRNLALSTNAEISRQLSSILKTDELIAAIVNQIQEAYHYYHVHIYLLNETQQELMMAGGTGEVGLALLGEGHKIPLGKGLVGRAAETKQTILVADVTQEETWLPNPLLPDTKAEIAVPIVSEDDVLGVLDVQENRTGSLAENDVQMLELTARQLAISFQNARFYESVQAQARREAIANAIGQKLQRASDIESVLQIAAQELGQSLNYPRVSVQLNAAADRKNGRG